MIDLEGQTALVTGATRGIGAAIALALAEAGADIMCVSANAKEDSETACRVRQLGRRFSNHRVDLSNRCATETLCRGIEAEAPTIDILINNAGTIRRGPVETLSAADFDAVMETNLAAPFLLTQCVAKGMLERGAGKIVFIASILGFQGGINVPAYATSKGAVLQLTRAMANEWASRGINVNAIAPGYVATDINTALQDDKARYEEIRARTPAGRWGRPKDIAGAAVFLSSPYADFIHGAVLPVDGGWLAR